MGNPNSPKMSAEVPGQVQPYATDLLNKGDAFSSTYSGANTPKLQTLGFTGYEGATIDTLKKALANPDPLTSSGSQYISDVLGGKYLNPNTSGLKAYTDALTSASNKQLAGNIDSLASQFGLYGGASSSALANAKMRALVDSNQNLNNILAGVYQNTYSQERNNQQNVLGAAQSYGQDTINRLLQALNLGGQERSLAQAQQGDAYTNFVNARQSDLSGIQALAMALQGVPLSRPQYAPSQLEQNLGLVFQGLNAGANVYKAYKGGS